MGHEYLLSGLYVPTSVIDDDDYELQEEEVASLEKECEDITYYLSPHGQRGRETLHS